MNAIARNAGSSNALKVFGEVNAIVLWVFVVTVRRTFMIAIARRNAITPNVRFGLRLTTYEGQVRSLWLRGR